MKNSSLRFVIALLTLVLGAAAEELLPKFIGVGVPVLLSSVPVFAARHPAVLSVLYALAAGGAEDALCGLPILTSASYFLVLTAAVRWTRLPALAALFAYPVYQVWLGLWCSGLRGSVFGRVLPAIPLGVLSFAAMASVLFLIERKAGTDEAG